MNPSNLPLSSSLNNKISAAKNKMPSGHSSPLSSSFSSPRQNNLNTSNSLGNINSFELNCQTYTNACSNSPCLNGGYCQVTGVGSTYTCTCNLGYTGTNCQTCNCLNDLSIIRFNSSKALYEFSQCML